MSNVKVHMEAPAEIVMNDSKNISSSSDNEHNTEVECGNVELSPTVDMNVDKDLIDILETQNDMDRHQSTAL